MTKDLGDRSPRSPGEANASARPVPSALAALIEDLERATEGSAELSLRVFLSLYPNSPKGPIAYTTSLDAALTLVPSDWYVTRIGQVPSQNPWWVAECRRTTPVGWVSSHEDDAGYAALHCRPKSAAIALCVAALRARLSSLQGESDREASRSSPSAGCAGDAVRNEDQS